MHSFHKDVYAAKICLRFYVTVCKVKLQCFNCSLGMFCLVCIFLNSYQLQSCHFWICQIGLVGRECDLLRTDIYALFVCLV